MSTNARGNTLTQSVVTAIGALLSIAGTSIAVSAQNANDLEMPAVPISLKAVGSFFVGGRSVIQTPTETGVYGGGSAVVDQMYVQYMIPASARTSAVVFIHGSALSGKEYETTPDGRMGWYEYFVREGFPTYVVDQVNRGRSGFDQARFNAVRSNDAPPNSQSNLRRPSEEVAWVRFRLGPETGVRFSDSQFPTDAAGQLAKQSVPDLSPSSSSDSANYVALNELAEGLQKTVLVGHSQSGRFPFEAAIRNPRGIEALVAIEPSGCNAAGYTDESIAKLAKFPILIVFGDHLDASQKYGSSWLDYFKDCERFVHRVHAASGEARMLHLPDLNIRGNSHMLMQDRNNQAVADLIIQWIKHH